MITETREIYKCEFCKKIYQIKQWCKKHEPKCKKNPANFSKCFECNYIEKIEVEYQRQLLYGEETVKTKILFCNKKQIGVHPFWIDGLELFYIGDDEYDNIVMPKECDDFKIKEY